MYVSDLLCMGILLRPVCVMLMGTTPAACAAAPDAANKAESSPGRIFLGDLKTAAGSMFGWAIWGVGIRKVLSESI